MHTFRNILIITFLGLTLSACSSVISSAKEKMARDLSSAITNNDDLETVKAGAPAYLLMLDSFIEGDPDDVKLLLAAARLYSAYAGVFVRDENRSKRLTQKALNFSFRANCLQVANSCNLKEIKFDQFAQIINSYNKEQLDLLFTLGSTWAGWIQNHSSDWNAAADLARVTHIMKHVLKLDETYQSGQVHLYMGILNTILPPALGGKPKIGKTHFERAIKLSGGKNLIAKVIYAEKYARLMFDETLHNKLLNQVIKAEPRIRGFTLTNMLAHEQAKKLLKSGKDYF